MVKVRGLPWSCSADEVQRFFSGESETEAGVKQAPEAAGRASEEATATTAGPSPWRPLVGRGRHRFPLASARSRLRLRNGNCESPTRPALPPYLSLHSGAPGRSAVPRRVGTSAREARGKGSSPLEDGLLGQVGARRLLSSSRWADFIPAGSTT